MKGTGLKLVLGLVAVITVLGLLRYKPFVNARGPVNADVIHEGGNKSATQELTVGFLPVTCHLTCPVTDFASKTTSTNTNFNSRLFTDFPTVASAIEAKQV